MVEEGGLGILTPDELSRKQRDKKRVKTTTRQNTIRTRIYQSVREESSELRDLIEMLASLKTRVVEHKKTSCIVYDWSEPQCVRRGQQVVKVPTVETVTEKDPFADPKGWQ